MVVAENTSVKKWLCVDYFPTINKFTDLDVFPVPLMQSVINQLHGHRFFTTLDLRSAYHHVSLLEADRPFTAFEADGNLWQFTRLSFCVTNGVPVFCRVMKKLLRVLKELFIILMMQSSVAALSKNMTQTSKSSLFEHGK